MTMTVPELATLLSTDGKTTRRFLRSITPKEGQPGKGGRWIIDEDQLDDLRDKYNSYRAADQARREALAAKAPKKTKTKAPLDMRLTEAMATAEAELEADDFYDDIDTENIDLIDMDADLI